MAPHRVIGKKTLGAAAMLAMGFGLVSPAMAQDGGRDRQRQQDRRGDGTRDDQRDQDPRDRRIEQLEKRLAEREAAIKKLKEAIAEQGRDRRDGGNEDRGGDGPRARRDGGAEERDGDGARAQQKRMEERLTQIRKRLADGQFDDVRKRLEEALRDGNGQDFGAIRDRILRELKERSAQRTDGRQGEERGARRDGEGRGAEPRRGPQQGPAARGQGNRDGQAIEMRIRRATMLSNVFRRLGLNRLADGAERRAEALRGSLERGRGEDGRPGTRGRTEPRGQQDDGRAPRAGNGRPGAAGRPGAGSRDGRDDRQDDGRDEPLPPRRTGPRGERRLV